jgi:CelD/BcsL family acetyltransferase involved in cellulose biosynthesis
MYIVDPLNDLRWAPFVERHAAACAFHTQGWLRALSLTYGYEPFAVTSSAPGRELTDAVPFCRIASWATGRRLVSLPFTDHCQPLVPPDASMGAVVEFLAELSRREKYKFFELRPAGPLDDAAVGDENRSAAYYIHWLDLTPSLEAIFSSFQKDSIQRKIRRADREGLQYEEGRSPEIIKKFYGLLVRTRRRHQLPPQPMEWFQNLASAMGEAIQFRIALKDDLPVAAIVTLTHRNSLIYKYGCSDERYHATGSMPFLFWRMIQEAKNASIPLVDFGRSDLDNPGLIRFKDQWGTRRTELTYYRFPAPSPARSSFGFAGRAAKAIFARLPDSLLALAGKKIYRHIG